jgi:hypothetical protein
VIIIRSEQIRDLEKKRLDSFVQSIADDLRRDFPEYAHFTPQKELEIFIRDSISIAETYGLDSEYTIARFIDYRLRLDSDIPTRPEHKWALDILCAQNLSADEKVAAIDHFAFQHSEQDEN